MKQEQSKEESSKSAYATLHQARALMNSEQPGEALRLIDTLPESIQQSGWALILRARALIKTGDTEQSRIALVAAENAGVDEKAVLEVRSLLQKLLNDEEQLAVTLARLTELDPNNFSLHARRARNMMALGRAEDAANAARKARDLAPEDPAMHGLICKVAVSFGNIEGYVEALEYALAHLPGPLPSGFLSHLRMMQAHDMGDLPARIEARWPGSLSIRRSKRLPPAPQATWRRKLVQKENQVGTLLCSPPGESGITIVWFGGIANHFDIQEAVDTHAAAAGCNAIYVCDPKHSLNQPGDRSKDPLTALLRAEIAKFRSKKLIVCGASIGGCPALFYGLALKADRLISLSGPTTARTDQLAEMGDRRGPMIVASLQRKMPLEQLDFRPAILAASKQKTRKPFRYDLYYGADRPIDRRHAERLAGIRGVTLYPIDGFAEHSSFTGLIDRGRAGEIFTV